VTDESKPPPFRQLVLCFLAASLLYALVRYLFFADNAEEATGRFLWEALGAVVAALVWTGLAAIPTPQERKRERDRRGDA
jgi:hypothetical protein